MKNKLRSGVLYVWLMALLCSPAFAVPAHQLVAAANHADYSASDGDDKKQEKKQSLINVLENIQVQHNVFFTYDANLLDGQQVQVQKSTSANTVEELLETYLKPLSLQYKKTGDQYYVIYRNQQRGEVEKIKREDPRSQMDTSQP
jgi:hypothetical protein